MTFFGGMLGGDQPMWVKGAAVVVAIIVVALIVWLVYSMMTGKSGFWSRKDYSLWGFLTGGTPNHLQYAIRAENPMFAYMHRPDPHDNYGGHFGSWDAPFQQPTGYTTLEDTAGESFPSDGLFNTPQKKRLVNR